MRKFSKEVKIKGKLPRKVSEGKRVTKLPSVKPNGPFMSTQGVLNLYGDFIVIEEKDNIWAMKISL